MDVVLSIPVFDSQLRRFIWSVFQPTAIHHLCIPYLSIICVEIVQYEYLDELNGFDVCVAFRLFGVRIH